METTLRPHVRGERLYHEIDPFPCLFNKYEAFISKHPLPQSSKETLRVSPTRWLEGR